MNRLLTRILITSIATACAPMAGDESANTEDPALVLGPIIYPYVARHGMTGSQYQAEFDELVAQGYRLTRVSAYDLSGSPRFAAIWEKKPGPNWVARHGMTSAQYQAEFDQWVGQGYRLVVVDGYESSGQARYAALWEQRSGPAWVARHGLTSAQYQAEFDSLVAQGYRLTWVQGYGVGSSARYAAIWEMRSGPAWVARHGMTSSGYQNEFDDLTALGYRLTHVSAYDVGGVDYYAAIWELSSSRTWVARHRLTSGGYQHQFVDRQLQGYRLKIVDGYAIGGSARYAALWVAEPNAIDGTYCQNGYCFDLERFADNLEDGLLTDNVKYGFEVRRGLSVIQRATGPKRTAHDAPAQNFTVSDRFNPASVSKSVTAIATLQLLARHNIDVDTPVHHYLPSSWNIPANNQTITFAELMNHTSGLRGSVVDGHYYEDMKELMEHEISLRNKVYDYDNTNYSLQRILVAGLDGYSDWANNPGPNSAARFIDYVNDEIFAPLGIYNVEYEPAAVAPTLFYPNPPGSAHGTTYGDWSLRPGTAGVQLSVHELAVFGAAAYHSILLDNDTEELLKDENFGFNDYSTVLPDGSSCYGKGGYFPGTGGWNGGAELNSRLIHCTNGLTAMLVVNGFNAGSIFAKLQASFVAE